MHTLNLAYRCHTSINLPPPQPLHRCEEKGPLPRCQKKTFGQRKSKGKGNPAMDIALMPVVCMACPRTQWTHHQSHQRFMLSVLPFLCGIAVGLGTGCDPKDRCKGMGTVMLDKAPSPGQSFLLGHRIIFTSGNRLRHPLGFAPASVVRAQVDGLIVVGKSLHLSFLGTARPLPCHTGCLVPGPCAAVGDVVADPRGAPRSGPHYTAGAAGSCPPPL